MKDTIREIAHAFIPNKTTLQVFSIFVILFFATLKSNPIETAITELTPLKLHTYHKDIAPYTPVPEQDESFGSDAYCIEATAIFSCAAIYPKETAQNIGLWYMISAPIAGLINRFKKDSSTEEEQEQ